MNAEKCYGTEILCYGTYIYENLQVFPLFVKM